MTVRIVHLFPDSPFLRFTAEMFESAAPGANTFLVYAATGDVARHGLPATAAIETLIADDAGLRRANDAISAADIAIFHSVGSFAARALNSAPAGTLKVWSGWGGDYYGSDWSGMAGLLDPLTARYDRRRLTLPGKVQQTYRRLRTPVREVHRAAGAADVFSAPVPEDYAVFRRRFPEFHGRYAQLNYASVEDTYAVGAEAATGDDILLGNSASLPNNHLDVLEILSRADIAGRRIVAPLSYGDPRYADAVTARGRELFGEAFLPLRDFLPLPEYQALIAGCSAVVMGHHRQQAVGNVASALWTGARVILQDRSPLFAFLRDRGADVAPLSGVARAGVPRARASAHERERNREVLTAFWSRERVLANIRGLIASA
ncbi:MAG: TDP-N-acetylfucosamine:lipid II N-acetylfucosaminyltransferase [Microbacterium sp.]|uniref:TDP-N-acetylfucosamine:lipid II N-acetylfucosaminyltransferase n=1 Tax=Microbacterium sp. TaxID=51671 RepID=UPI001AC62E69|nr:TDP-N-acetylfucosamine:lipid II N-acetylfucosaminyltransferase [Microbacterium sp.]MBN9154207.1 TDP-N-acetylfucosamine:lipid II N-acetylfucosaminyltransferase [Microbacterium sp.]MBN9172073.1 TDP-N-acetylfucosamine:lipid II N-acetylfucosaminyltransferase [Microbacterium sp.]